MPEEKEDGLTKASGLARNIYSILILIGFLVSLGTTWGVFTSKVSSLETNFAEYKGATKEKINKLEGQVFQLELNKASNDVVIKNIDDNLEEIKQSIKDLKEGN